jgi:hypothetical protein
VRGGCGGLGHGRGFSGFWGGEEVEGEVVICSISDGLIGASPTSCA